MRLIMSNCSLEQARFTRTQNVFSYIKHTSLYKLMTCLLAILVLVNNYRFPNHFASKFSPDFPVHVQGSRCLGWQELVD